MSLLHLLHLLPQLLSQLLPQCCGRVHVSLLHLLLQLLSLLLPQRCGSVRVGLLHLV